MAIPLDRLARRRARPDRPRARARRQRPSARGPIWIPSRALDPSCLRRDRRHRERHQLAVALDDVDDRWPTCAACVDRSPDRRVLVGVLDVADLHDHVARLQPGDRGGRRLPVRSRARPRRRGRMLRFADDEQQDRERRSPRHQEVRERAAEDHDDPLPDRLGPVGAMLVARRHVVLERVHPGDLHVAAGRDRLHAVLDLAAAERPEPRAEPEEVLEHTEAEPAASEVVTDLVDHDDREQRDDEERRSTNANPTGASAPR